MYNEYITKYLYTKKDYLFDNLLKFISISISIISKLIANFSCFLQPTLPFFSYIMPLFFGYNVKAA